MLFNNILILKKIKLWTYIIKVVNKFNKKLIKSGKNTNKVFSLVGYRLTHLQLGSNLFNPWVKWVGPNATHIQKKWNFFNQTLTQSRRESGWHTG